MVDYFLYVRSIFILYLSTEKEKHLIKNNSVELIYCRILPEIANS